MIYRIFPVVLLIAGYSVSGKSEEVTLAKDGQGLHSVVVGEYEMSMTIINAAKDLAKYLGKISGATFTVKRGDGTEGIVVGNYLDFPALGLDSLFNPDDYFRQDEYLMRSHGKGIYLLGATELSAQFAVWDLLYRFGYRNFFPGKVWEIVPENDNLTISIDEFESPDWIQRNAPKFPARTPSWVEEDWENWSIRNRTKSSVEIWASHVYQQIISENKKAFDDHPEYYGLVDGKRTSSKICIGNPDLRKLVVDWAINYFNKNPDAFSVSMEPSDGGGWCECDKCAELGSITDRAVTLANEVATAINEKFENKYVGLLAYNQHSPPPHIEVHPNVIVRATTSYIRGGFSFDELLDEWGKKVNILGMSDYYSVIVWHDFLTGQSKASNTEYLLNNLPHYYKKGARLINASAYNDWGTSGLGYYLSSRIIWDIDEAQQGDTIIHDFLEKCFGPAYEPMKGFYELIDGSARDEYAPFRKQPLNDDMLHKMYRWLSEARALAEGHTSITNRIDDLIFYTRFIDLYCNVEKSSGEMRQNALNELVIYCWNIRIVNIVPSNPMFVQLESDFVKDGITMPEGFEDLKGPDDGYDKRENLPYKEAEILNFLEDGMERNKIHKLTMDFEPVNFSEDLVPAAEMLNLPEVENGMFDGYHRGEWFRGKQKMYTWFGTGVKKLPLRVTGGLIAHFQDRGNVKFKLYYIHTDSLELVNTDESVPPDASEYEIVLESPYEGLHLLEWNDGEDQTQILWPDGFPMTMCSSTEDPANLNINRQLYFYVPKGTKTVGGFSMGDNNYITRVHDGDGKQIFFMEDNEDNGYFSIPVPEGQDGKLWYFRRAYGIQMLMTVPPYLARNEQELLLPREVVEADKTTSVEGISSCLTGTIHVYPNPANEILYIQNHGILEETQGITIFNSEGRNMKILPANGSNSGMRNIDVSDFLPGLYFVKVELKDRTVTKKVVIK